MTFLDVLEPQERALIETYLRPVRFRQGDCIIRQGDPGDGGYLIDEGEVRLELLDVETDSDSVLGYLDPGMFLGEFSLIDGESRSSFAYAHTDVRARYFAQADFQELCERYPGVGLTISNAMARNLTAKLRGYVGRMTEYLFADAADAATDAMVARARLGQRELACWPEERVDALLEALAKAVAERAEELAQACVEETRIGRADHKVAKIRFASLDVYRSLAGHRAAGTLQTDLRRRITEIAAPMGVVLGLIPLTNPVSTIIFKTLICLKSRNALIYSCHHNALGVGNQTGDIIHASLAGFGAPVELVQWVRERTSRRKTTMLMRHKGIAMILATGGPSLVKAAYSSGTPAIGVGAGNAPAWICADADPAAVSRMIVESKSFDNGVLCASENNLVVDLGIWQALVECLVEQGAAVLEPHEKAALVDRLFDLQGRLDRAAIGQSGREIARRAGIARPYEIRLLVVPASLPEINGPLGREKLAPIVSLFTVAGEEEGLWACKQILNNEGLGHTAAIHTHDEALIERFGLEIDASRIFVNVGTVQGILGTGTCVEPSLTLGCGTFGGNSTTDSVTYRHLFNVKRLVRTFSPVAGQIAGQALPLDRAVVLQQAI